jgi:deoxyribose-phosphate aldolase
MNLQDTLSHVDHTLLKQTATWEEIRVLCDQGLEHKVASVCIPPSYVKQASDYLNGTLPICTVIGFPNGYHSTEVKVFETRRAIQDGADELDMVINLGWVKDRQWNSIYEEIRRLKQECQPQRLLDIQLPDTDETIQDVMAEMDRIKANFQKNHILKVIVETCLLTEEEKETLCEIVSNAGADYIKTSTGFSSGGATVSDVQLFRRLIGPEVKIKAAGGIRTPEDAEAMLAAGADRLGSSALAAN